MDATEYAEVCEEVYKRLMTKLVKGPSGHHFAVNGTAKEVLDLYTMGRLFRCLDLGKKSSSSLKEPAQGPVEESVEEPVEDRLMIIIDSGDLYNFLATLIYANCSIRAARTFADDLLTRCDLPISWKLPVSQKDLHDLLQDEVDVHKFLNFQPCFCPLVIQKREHIRIEDTEEHRLPYLEETLLGSGSYGTVYKVTIAPGHFVDDEHKAPFSKPIVIARKDYTISQKLAYEKEHEAEIMRKILSTRLTCENVVESLGSFAVGPSTYSLFMPLAECDLWEYMTSLSPAAPNLSAKPSILFSAQGLAEGLDFLHTGIRTRTGEKLVCYHMDLKPSNILVFRGSSEGYSDLVWKISDFGMARVKRVETSEAGSDGVGERDFNSWFVRRKQAPAPSGTANRHGDGTYLAPESLTANRNMRTNSDVWSLGCVMSVLFAYLEDGARGVNAYSEKRVNDPSSQGYDRFFVRSKLFAPLQINPAVKKWHSDLVVKARHRSPQEREAVEFMLSHLEQEVFREQASRCEVLRLKRVIQETYRRYNDLENPQVQASRRPDANPVSELRSHISHFNVFNRHATKSCLLQRNVYKWVLASSDPFKGSAISPDGTVVAFWTDFKISLYTDASLHPAESNGAASTASAVAHYEISDNILDTVRVTDKLLVASTSAANFECYVFDLEEGPSAGESLLSPQRVILPLPKIQRLAISPESSTVAFILRDKDDEKNPGSLYCAPILSTSMRTLCQSKCRHKMLLGWPAVDAVRMSFSTENDIWIVFRPHITTNEWDHKTQIIHVGLKERKWDHLKIQLKSPDGNHQVGLYTTFAPFVDPPSACAVVTREERLHVESLGQDSGMPSIEADIHGYRILTLMMGWDSKRLFAIGKKLASHKILLLEMRIPSKVNKGVSVAELAAFPDLSDDDDFTVKLSSQENEKFVVLAARIERDQRAIYRVRII